MNKLVLLVLGLLILGCYDVGYHKKLNDGYYISAIDIKENMSIGFKDGKYGIGIISPTVFAVGQNEKFIIVKQRPKKGLNSMQNDTTNYYIIPLRDKISRSAEKNLFGPMSKIEFDRKRIELEIPDDLLFTHIFHDLE